MTPSMREALESAYRDPGGVLVRQKGGRWIGQRDAIEESQPHSDFGTSTINALVACGALKVVARGRSKVPHAVKVQGREPPPAAIAGMLEE